jgi:hypothetical protein
VTHPISGADAARTFIEAFDREDLDALIAVLDPEVEIQTSRGVVIGHEEARRWATRTPTGELRQRLVLDWVRDEGRHVIVGARREWLWHEDGRIADAQDLAIVATIGDDGRILRWQPFEDRAEALRAAGVTAGGP